MAKRTAVLLAVLAILALFSAGAATGVFDGWLVAPPPPVASPQQATADDAASTKPGLRAGAARPAPATADEALPPPVDLEKVDRDLDLHGVVVTKDGEPVAGALLTAVRFPWRRGRLLSPPQEGEESQDRGQARTARDGTFAIRLSRGEQVRLRAVAVGFADVEMSSCQAGERLRIEMAPGVRLTVTARERDGAPVNALRLLVDRWERFGRLELDRTGTTDADGRCVFENLPGACTCTVSVQHETLGTASYTRVVLPAAGEAAATLEVPAGRTISGLVTDVDTGAPIAGALVGMAWGPLRPASTGADGTYSITGWRGDSFLELRASAKGYANRFAAAGSKAKTVNFKLKVGVGVRARILDSTGRPVGGARVGAVGPTVEMSNNATMGTSTSSADGRIEIVDLDPKIVHALAVIAEGFGLLLLDFDPPPEGQSIVDLGDVTLPAPGAIEGRVTDAEEHPVVGARIDVEGSNADRGRLRPGGHGRGPDQIDEQRTTDDLGRFRFQGLAAGDYTLRAVAPGLPDRKRDVRLTADHDVLDLEIRFPRLYELLVVVEDAAGHPVAGAHVEATDDEEGDVSAETDASGRAPLASERPPETASIAWFEEGVGPYLVPPSHRVPAGQREVRFVVEAAGHASGVVLGPDDKPLANAEIHSVRDGTTVAESRAGPDGKFRIKVPASEAVSLVLHPQLFGKGRRDDRPLLEGRVDDVTAEDAGVTLRAHPVARDRKLEVMVLSPDGSPVEAAEVFVEAVADGGSLETGADGLAAFGGLPALTVEVTATPGAALHPGAPWVDAKSQTVLPQGQRVVLHLRNSARLSGRVLGPAGKPVEGASAGIRAYRDPDADWSPRPLGADGRFAMDVDPERGYTLRAFALIGGLPHQAVKRDVRTADGEVTLTLEAVK